MINAEAIRACLRAYAAASDNVRQMMETELMNLLEAQHQFDRQHQNFIAHTLYSLRRKDEDK